ncbi:MAG: ABC transporter substrate-binding protein [Pseudomonadota bacterium]
MNKRQTLQHLLLAFSAALGGHALAAEPIRLATVIELSGPGATAGTNFKNGMDLAFKEINAGGGILGHKLENTVMDTQSNPGLAKSLTQKAIEQDVFAVFGPVFSGSIIVSMAETRRAGIPNFTGGEAANITQQGNPYIFRTSFTQQAALPKVARYISRIAQLKTIAIVYGNNDFGKGGHEVMLKALDPAKTKVVADIATDPGQTDFAAAVLKVKQSNADGVFVYVNEEESARVLKELRKQGWSKPVIGETTLLGQKVIDLAGSAANGAVAHVGLTVDAPNPPVRAFRAKFEKEYKYVSDHNGMKGYSGVYMLKAALEKAGKVDRKAVTAALHGLKVSAAQQPGILVDVQIDDKGDLNRESYMVEVKNGKQEVVLVLPAIGE